MASTESVPHMGPGTESAQIHLLVDTGISSAEPEASWFLARCSKSSISKSECKTTLSSCRLPVPRDLTLPCFVQLESHTDAPLGQNFFLGLQHTPVPAGGVWLAAAAPGGVPAGAIHLRALPGWRLLPQAVLMEGQGPVRILALCGTTWAQCLGGGSRVLAGAGLLAHSLRGPDRICKSPGSHGSFTRCPLPALVGLGDTRLFASNRSRLGSFPPARTVPGPSEWDPEGALLPPPHTHAHALHTRTHACTHMHTRHTHPCSHTVYTHTCMHSRAHTAHTPMHMYHTHARHTPYTWHIAHTCMHTPHMCAHAPHLHAYSIHTAHTHITPHTMYVFACIHGLWACWLIVQRQRL